MALRGSLKDFGIADVFSLVGSQQKHGVMIMARGDESVSLYFDSGCVVRAEAARRRKRELLGNMLIRAEAITEQQLEAALERQKQSHRRVGDLLIELGALTADSLATFTRLQTTETVYRVFLWQNGTYEFNQSETPPAGDHAPVKGENLLMEGFRQVDEWPAIRQQLTSYGIRFNVAKDLDALVAEAAAKAPPPSEMDFDFEMGDGAAEPTSADPRLRNIGDREKAICKLITPKRDVQKLIDLSRMGEFEACKALSNLLAAGIITARAEKAKKPSAEATVGGIAPAFGGLPAGVGQYVIGSVAAAVLWVLICASGLSVFTGDGRRVDAQFLQTHLEQELGRGAQERIVHALGVYHAVHGAYPQTLTTLVSDGLLNANEAQFPWRGPYTYTHTEQEYVLLPPVY